MTPLVTRRPRLDWRARFARVEPELQSNGFIVTFGILYLLLTAIVFVYGAAPDWAEAAALRKPPYQRVAAAAARGSGALLNVNSGLIVLLAARRLVTYLRSTALNMVVPFDKAMPAFHSLVGHVLVLAAAVHVAGHAVNYAVGNMPAGSSPRGFHGTTSLLATGAALALFIAAIRVTVLPRIRRTRFEVFYYTHVTAFVAYYAFIVVHGAHHGVLSSWKFVVGPLAIYCADRLSRLARENVSRLEIAQSNGRIQGPDVVCLRLPRTFAYLAGQYCDIKVPQVSNVEWHPFTIASSPHESEMVFYIKKNGDWTERLHNLFSHPNMGGDDAVCQVHVRGPFGAPAEHCGQYEHVVLIGGGVGATPFCSIAKYAHHWILDYTERGINANRATTAVTAAFARTLSTQHQTPGGSGSATPLETPHGSARNLSAVSGDGGGGGAGGGGSRNFIRNVSSRFGRTASTRSGAGRPRPDDRQVPQPAPGGIYFQGRVPSHSDVGGLPLTLPGAGPPPPPPANLASLQGFLSESVGTESSLGGDYPDDLGDPDAPIVSRRSRLYSSAGQCSSPGVSGDLGDPDAPLVSRRSRLHNVASAGGSPPPPPRRRGLGGHDGQEVVREYDSSRSLFSSSDDGLEEDEEDEDGEDVRTGSNAAVRERRARPPHVTLPLGSDRDGGWEGGAAPAEPVQDSMEFENMLLRDAPADSNAANLMGLSYGSTAMMRHMLTADQQMGAGLRRASMNVLDEVLDSAGWEERALFYLHTVTVNWVLLWIMLARYCMAALAGITNGFLLGQRGLAVFSTKALIIVDVVLAIALAFPVNFAVALELKLHGLVAFLSDSYGNTFDILLLVPLSAACCVLSILGLIGVGADTQHVSKMTLLLFWPTLSLLLLWRMGRTIGSRISLAQYFKSTHSQTKSLDFIWVSKSEDDDEWLVREMLPLTEEKIVRLHRYVTRGDASRVEPWTLDYANIPLRTQHKRPDWDEVFAGIAGRSKSGSVIGVFYCGPPAMARGVEQGAMKAMATSTQKAYKQGYMQAMGDSAVERNGNQAADGGSSHGCAVRFALREENFG